MYFFFFILLLSLISLIAFYNFYWKRRNLPPGPIPLPLIGNTLNIAKADNVYEVFQEWAKTYGPIHTFWLKESPIVAITDYNMIMEYFVKDSDSCSGRHLSPDLVEFLRRGNYGIVHTQGELWKEQRRFTLRVLRDFGFGKNIMQERILDEVTAFIKRTKDDINAGIDVHNIITNIDIAIGSFIVALIFGYRYDEKRSKEVSELKQLVESLFKAINHPLRYIMQKNSGLFKHIPYLKNVYVEIKNASDGLFEFLERQVKEHMVKIDLNAEPADFCDAYLKEKAKRDEAGETHNYTIIQLLNVLFDLWIAGQETTSNTLAWGIVYLILNQDAQKKLQEELDHNIESNRLVTLEDRPKLPYTMAVANEILRMSNIVPINILHNTLKDVEIEGYHIPAGTNIIPHISVMLLDSKIFPEPQSFKPERFLDEARQPKKIDEFIPFGVGKRQCLGASLASTILFLFTANIFNQFKITSVEGQPPSLKRKFRATIPPQPFVCNVQNRF